jgi:hypothetical protein
MILSEAHEGVAGGHYAGKETTQNIFVQDCGGLPFIRMLRNFVRLVMFSKELGSLPGEMRCR